MSNADLMHRFAPAASTATGLSGRLADMVVAALIDEATLTPKPGLVDMRAAAAHADLSWALMCHSAGVLRPSFEAMAQAGTAIGNAGRLRERIGALGRTAEHAMMQATGGINTHRGAIWAMGLLVTAAAQAPRSLAPAAVAARAAALARRPDRFAPVLTGNKGERACHAYGVGGARAQAQAGFPHIVKHALPRLHASRTAGDGEGAARLNALLAVIAELDDTCILSRGGSAALHAAQAGAHGILAAGGVAGAAGKRLLAVFEADLLARNLSPGGAADLLAATLFLDRLQHTQHPEHTAHTA